MEAAQRLWWDVIGPLIVAVLVSAATTFVHVQIVITELRSEIENTAKRVDGFEKLEEKRNQDSRELRDLMIRADQKLTDIDRRTRRLEDGK